MQPSDFHIAHQPFDATHSSQQRAANGEHHASFLTSEADRMSLDQIFWDSSLGDSSQNTYTTPESFAPWDTTAAQKDEQIALNYQGLETSKQRRGGASGFLAYLRVRKITLAQVGDEDLNAWALTPSGKGNLPDVEAFAGAKNLCALAAQVGHLPVAPAALIAACVKPMFSIESLCNVLATPGMTDAQKDEQIGLNYQSSEKDNHRRAGANSFLIFLRAQNLRLNQVSDEHINTWALTPNLRRNLPCVLAFAGAKSLCARAAQAGHLPPAPAALIVACTRPEFSIESLCNVLATPGFSASQKDHQIMLNYQSGETDTNYRGGAKSFLAYLHAQKLTLDEASYEHLNAWALTPHKKANLPSAKGFMGAKNLCGRAALTGHLPAASAASIEACTQPEFSIGSLCNVLATPGITTMQKDEQIALNYQSSEQNNKRRGGANGFLAYLHAHSIMLNEATTQHINAWALTPNVRGHIPHPQAFIGAQNLCARAAQTGHLPAASAARIAMCTQTKGSIESLRDDLETTGLTAAQQDKQIALSYQSSDTNIRRRGGASSFLTYLRTQNVALKEARPEQLNAWALTPNRGGKLPHPLAFAGAKNLCIHAMEAGHLPVASAALIAGCKQPELSIETLRNVLKIPGMTAAQKDEQIALNYQSSETDIHRQCGASSFLAYLSAQNVTLNHVSNENFNAWALTPNGRGNLPSAPAYVGARELCARAMQAGHLLPAPAALIAGCTQPEFSIGSLRNILAIPGMDAGEKDAQIALNYQSSETNSNSRAGANSFLAHLRGQNMTLNHANAEHLNAWALTPNGRGNLPDARAFAGAQNLCARAAQAGHLPAAPAALIAVCIPPVKKRKRVDSELDSCIHPSNKDLIMGEDENSQLYFTSDFGLLFQAN